MKTYIGERRSSGTRVFVRGGETEAPLRHHLRHSPTGFEWGYAGSGPADLARCILIDHFGAEAVCERCEDGWVQTEEGRERCWECWGEVYRLPVSYQEFKFRFIASLPSECGWEITEGEVEAWVCESRDKEMPRADRAGCEAPR